MSGPPGQYVHFPWGQAYGLGITAPVVPPLALRTCFPIRRGLSLTSSEPETRWRRSELGGTVGERCNRQTSILIRLMSSREGWSRLRRRSIISVETISAVWLNLRTFRSCLSRTSGVEPGQLGVSRFGLFSGSPVGLDLPLSALEITVADGFTLPA